MSNALRLGLGHGSPLRGSSWPKPFSSIIQETFDRMGDGSVLSTPHNGLSYSNLATNLSSANTFNTLHVEPTVTDWTAFLGNVGLQNVGWKGLADRAFGMYTTSAGSTELVYRINFTAPTGSTSVAISFDAYAAWVRLPASPDKRWERIAVLLRRTSDDAIIGGGFYTTLTNALIDNVNFLDRRVYLPEQLPLGSSLRTRHSGSRAVDGGQAYYLEVRYNRSAEAYIGVPAGFPPLNARNMLGAINNLSLVFS